MDWWAPSIKWYELGKEAEELQERLENEPNLTTEEIEKITDRLDEIYDLQSEIHPNKKYLTQCIELGVI